MKIAKALSHWRNIPNNKRNKSTQRRDNPRQSTQHLHHNATLARSRRQRRLHCATHMRKRDQTDHEHWPTHRKQLRRTSAQRLARNNSATQAPHRTRTTTPCKAKGSRTHPQMQLFFRTVFPKPSCNRTWALVMRRRDAKRLAQLPTLRTR